MNHPYKKNILASIILVLIFSACAIQRSPVTGDKRAYGFSWAQAKKLGAQADQQIQAQFGVYDNESLQKYVEGVAEKVLAVSDMRDAGTPKKYQDTEFTFRVLASPVVNAFALPGGYVYVTRGLLTHLKSEAQLAVVLGHEIGHVAARHASQSAFENKFSQILLLGGAVAGQQILGIPGGQILQLGSLARKYLFLSYSRDDEREADALGVEYAARQGYHTAAASNFFGSLERMQAKSGGIPNWLSSHPDPAARSARIPKLAQYWANRGLQQPIHGVDEFMTEINNIVYGDNPRLGFTRGGNFFHPELAFYFPYPIQWNLTNTPSVVQIVNDDGNAIILFQIDSKSKSPKESVLAFLQQDGIEATRVSDVSYNKLNGYEATAVGEAEGGENITFYLYSVAYNGNIYRFVTYTLTDLFSEYRNELQGTATNFQALTTPSILNIKPVQLDVHRAQKTGTFREFIPANLPFGITAEDVALANQVRLNETIEKGTWIKIPTQ